MHRLLFTAIYCFVCVSIVGQELDFDGNNDGCVNIEDMLGLLVEFGQCSEEESVFNSCGDSLNHYNYYYQTVQIGEKCWFQENLKYLPQINLPDDNSIVDPKFYVYNFAGETIQEAQETFAYNEYGVLYNYPAILLEETCPSGWHVSSLEDWNYILDIYGGEWVAGEYLRSEDWNNGNNESGLTLIASGFRHNNNNFAMSGFGGYWRTSTSSTENESWNRYTTNVNPNWLDSSSIPHDSGMSVRCVKD
ncbi:MAG: hypothetical protein CL847_06865 [Crocinitomicaceae bacterium]|nr:hypothetical protein [Crocinitomicaceae bacterium]